MCKRKRFKNGGKLERKEMDWEVLQNVKFASVIIIIGSYV